MVVTGLRFQLIKIKATRKPTIPVVSRSAIYCGRNIDNHDYKSKRFIADLLHSALVGFQGLRLVNIIYRP